MSYFADHLAWQQRVQQEFKATGHFKDMQDKTQAAWAQYPDLINYMLQNQGLSRKEGGTQLHKNTDQGVDINDAGNFQYAAKYTSSGNRPTKKRSTHSQHRSQYNSNWHQKQRFNETVDLQSNKQSIRSSQRSTNFNRINSSTLNNLQNDKVKGQGQKSVRSFSSSHLSGSRRPQTAGNKSVSHYSVKSKAYDSQNRHQATQQHRQTILKAVNDLSEKELEQISQMLKDQEKQRNDLEYSESNQQALTEQNLDQLEADQRNELQDDGNLSENQDEDLLTKTVDQRDGETISVAKLTEASRASRSISRATNSTYVSQLREQLQGERQARIDLENELAQLQSMGKNIQNKIQQKNGPQKE